MYGIVAMSEPALRYAVLCRDMLIRPRGISILGMIDGIIGDIRWSSIEPQLSGFYPPIGRSLVLALGLVGAHEGKHRLWIVVRTPSGTLEKSTAPQEFEVERELGITHVKANIRLDTVKSGVYRLYVLLDGEPLQEIELHADISIVCS